MFELRTKKILHRYPGSPKAWPHWRAEFTLLSYANLSGDIWEFIWVKVLRPFRPQFVRTFGTRTTMRRDKPKVRWQQLLRRVRC